MKKDDGKKTLVRPHIKNNIQFYLSTFFKSHSVTSLRLCFAVANTRQRNEAVFLNS